MYVQNNISNAQRLQEIKSHISGNDFNNRLLLLEVYRDELWQLDEVESFKEWIGKFTHYNYSTVHNWVVSDNIRTELQDKRVNASKWSDSAVLALVSLQSPLLEEIAQGLPSNPTKEQVKEAVDYVKPTDNLVTFPGVSKPSAKPQKSGGYSKVEKELEETAQEFRKTIIELKQENDELRQNSHYQKDTAIPSSELHVQKDTVNPRSDSEDVATADLRELVDTLHQQLEESRLETTRAKAEIKSLGSQPTPESIDDFAPDDKKIVAKQANRIEQLEAQVERLNQQLSDRSSTDIERKLSIAQHQIKSLESMIDCFGNPELEQRILNAVPKDEAEVLQFELNQAIALIDKQGAIVLNLEKSQKELKAEKSKLAMDNLQLAQKVQSLEELLKVPTPKAITAPAQITRPLPLPDVIVEAIAECEKQRYSAIVDRCPEGFAVAIGGKSTIFVDAEDVADYLFASLEQSMMTA